MAEYAQPLPGVTPHQTLGVVEAVFVRVLSAPGAADEQVIPARLKNFLSAGVNRIPLLGNLVRFHYVRTQQRGGGKQQRSEEHTSELQSRGHLVCRLLLEKKKNINNK